MSEKKILDACCGSKVPTLIIIQPKSDMVQMRGIWKHQKRVNRLGEAKHNLWDV